MSITSLDGVILDSAEALINLRDRGLMLGDGVFETLLVANCVALWRHDHLHRMEQAAALCGIPFDQMNIGSAIDNALGHCGKGPHVLRVMLTRGVTARGLAGSSATPSLILTCDPLDMMLAGKPVALMTSTYRRNGQNFSDRHKTISYMNNVAVAREAAAAGYEDALILSTASHVACTSIANVFLVSDGRLVTPPAEDGILEGIMRKFLMSKFECEVRHIAPGELVVADAVFITNSLRLVRPVVSLDGILLNTGDVSRYHLMILKEVRHQSGADVLENEP